MNHGYNTGSNVSKTVSRSEGDVLQQIAFKREIPRAQRRQYLKRKSGRATVVVSRKIAKNHKYLAAHGLPHSPAVARLSLGSRAARRSLQHAL